MAKKTADKKKVAPKKVAPKKTAPKKEAKKVEAPKEDWDLAETKLNKAISLRAKDGHHYNTVVAPLKEQFDAGGRNPQLYNALINL